MPSVFPPRLPLFREWPAPRLSGALFTSSDFRAPFPSFFPPGTFPASSCFGFLCLFREVSTLTPAGVLTRDHHYFTFYLSSLQSESGVECTRDEISCSDLVFFSTAQCGIFYPLNKYYLYLRRRGTRRKKATSTLKPPSCSIPINIF